jgi:hypothetical protein
MSMMRCSLTLLLFLGACVPGPPPPASQYRQSAVVSQIPLVFAPESPQLIPADDARLRVLGRTLPVQAVSTLHISGPLVFRRIRAVERSLARAVQAVDDPGMPPDQALLVSSGPAIVADSCRGPGVPELGSIWPSNDDVTAVLLPAGCATAVDVQVQTTRPGDLLQGQPLPPAAATPFAAAIERYYHRNDPPQASGAQAGGSSGSSDQSGSTGGTGSAGSGSTPNVLTGPLPAGAQ